MPRDVPAEFLTEAVASVCRPLLLFELLLDAGTRRYSSQSVTWNGNAYTRLATVSAEVSESTENKPQDARVVFSHVTGVLRDTLDPVDLLTGRRLVVRLVMRDASFAFIESGGSPASFILFAGLMERPVWVDEDSFEVTAFALPHVKKSLPPRKFTEGCTAIFADAFDCNYAGEQDACDRIYTSAAGCTGAERWHEHLGFRTARFVTVQLPDRRPTGSAGHASPWSQPEY